MFFYLQAAHAVLQLQETGKPVYKVKNVSLNALCELYSAPVNPMKEQVRPIKLIVKSLDENQQIVTRSKTFTGVTRSSGPGAP